MKKINLIFFILLLLILPTVCFAESTLNVTSNLSSIEVGQEVSVNINLENSNIAAMTLEIYWDVNSLEYVSGPENSNKLNNRILYTWVSDNGENKDNLNVGDYIFKGLQDGIGNIFVTGEYYNSEGQSIVINDSNTEIKIGKEEAANLEQDNNVSDDNTNLSILRLNHEGINPEFDKNIKEYYFITEMDINSLDVIAIPENSEASIEITGNNNLKIGENTIDIKVISKDKSKTSIYKIHVTRTNNIKLANANLETLAIRQGTLNPEYNENITKYNVDLGTNVDKIDILAIPQRENASVKILGNENIKIGNNLIQIIVTAENGTTMKKYELNIHRRNEEEEIKYQEEEKNDATRLATILEEKNKEEINNINNNENKNINNIKSNIVSPIILIIIIITIISIIFITINNKTKE